MGTTLTGTTPQDTYDSLIKVTDNGPLSGSLKKLTDGLGNDSSLSLSTTAASLSGTLAVSGTSTFSSALTAATGSNFTGTSTNSRIIVTAAGVANTILGFNNSGSTANGVVNNAGYIGILQDYPLVVTIADAEKMRITGAGNVGIGTSNPQQKLHVAGVAANSYALLGTSTNWGSADTNRIKIGSTGDTFTLGCDLRANTNYAGTTETSLGLWVTNGSSTMVEVVRATPNGLTFNGDTAAANALDDYEEGTWTITATPSSSGTITLDSGVNSGYYTKIGRQVTCTGLAEVSSVSSPTGTSVRFGGLPFAIAPRISEYEMRIGGAVTYNGATVVATPFTGTEGVTFVNVYIDASTVSAGNQFYFSFTYFV